MKIGLALSGGGFRATVFHLGVLARLAEEDRLEEVTFLSTVSGGSVCAGLVYAKSDFQWPSSARFISEVVPHARELLTTEDLQLGLIKRVLRSVLRAPWSIFQTRADDFSSLLQERWGITAQLSQVSDTPRWVINATCHETGRNWRFEKFWMGDYLSGYTRDADIPLSDALAASAALPGLVGPLVLDAADRSWFKYAQELPPGQDPAKPGPDTRERTEPVTPAYSEVHLWDGGIYDNLGVECLHNFDTGWRQGVDFLVVSDASGRGQSKAYHPGAGALIHIITDILMGQIRALRARSVVERMKNPEKDPGAFLRIGNTCKKVLEDAGRHAEVAELSAQCLPEEQATLAERMETTARKLSRDEFERLFRHGFEVADYTLYAYHPDKFTHIGYGNSRSGGHRPRLA